MIYLREFCPSEKHVDHHVVKRANWFELESVRSMYDFFMEHKDKFE